MWHFIWYCPSRKRPEQVLNKTPNINLKIPLETVIFSSISFLWPFSPSPALPSSSHAHSSSLGFLRLISLGVNTDCDSTPPRLSPPAEAENGSLVLARNTYGVTTKRRAEGGEEYQREMPRRQRTAELKTLRRRGVPEKEDRWHPIIWLGLV